MKHTNYLEAEFLRNKIDEAGTALCTLHHPSFWIKTHIISKCKVDTEGNICFRITQPTLSVALELAAFSISLGFHKKTLGYKLSVEALATIFESNGSVWVKAKPTRVQYLDYADEAEKSRKIFSLQNFSRRIMNIAGSFF